MITVTEYTHQAVGVFGLGKAGEATVASLAAGGAKVFAWDDKGMDGGRWAVDKDDAAIRHLSFVDYHDWPWAELKALVLSPGVPLTHPKPHAVVEMARRHGVPVLGDIELLYRACPKAKYVAITGTNGKSTTTTLIGHILKSAGLTVEVGGNLGTAALSLQPLGKEGIYVLELSSYQLDLVHTTRFNVAVFLNVTPDHLDRHGSMEGYVAAKMHMFDRQQAGDVAVIAVDDAYTAGIVNQTLETKKEATLINVSAKSRLSGGVYVEAGKLVDTAFPDSRFPIPDACLPGRHNWQNAAAAWAVARVCGVVPEQIYAAMKTFPGLRHRLQLVATIRGVRFINDSKATNADATSHALAPYESIYWIAGGKPKEGGIDALSSFFPKIAHAFLMGQAEEAFARTLDGQVPYTRCGTLKTAVEKAAGMAWRDGKPHAVVLLSPACASFDQWKNFEERGDAFCAYVEALAHAS